MISTRGRYAIRVLLDIAEHQTEGFVKTKDISERQGISQKYMEQIMPVLVKNNLLKGVSGKVGGYKLTKDKKDYIIGDILTLTEGDLAPVKCLKPDAEPCSRIKECKTLPMWKEYYKITKEFFNSKTLADLG